MAAERHRHLCGTAIASAVLAASAFAVPLSAQSPDPLRVTAPPVIVTAQKEPQDIQQLPLSVTAVSKEELAATASTAISDAAIFAPNTFFSEFQARKLSFRAFPRHQFRPWQSGASPLMLTACR